jgi:hypothetical protein
MRLYCEGPLRSTGCHVLESAGEKPFPRSAQAKALAAVSLQKDFVTAEVVEVDVLARRYTYCGGFPRRAEKVDQVPVFPYLFRVNDEIQKGEAKRNFHTTSRRRWGDVMVFFRTPRERRREILMGELIGRCQMLCADVDVHTTSLTRNEKDCERENERITIGGSERNNLEQQTSTAIAVHVR